MLIINPYKYSSSAYKLKCSLFQQNIPVVLLKQNSKYKAGPEDVVINWGNSGYAGGGLVINKPDNIHLAVNKILTFKTLESKGVKTVYYTLHPTVAKQWLEEDHPLVYCRTLAQSTKGKGIVIATTPDELVHAVLYTKGVRCKREYRVHVFNNKAIDLVAKCKRKGFVNTTDLVRNWENGYVFARNAVKIPVDIQESLNTLAIAAVNGLGLHFGAVDILRGEDDLLYVLEVNTAPGIDGSTITKYCEEIVSWL